MDVSTDPGALLRLRMGPTMEQAKLGVVKREADNEAAVATMAMQLAGAAPVDSNRGQNVNTVA